MKDLLSYRDEFDSIQNCHYLISNSLGAMPNSVSKYSEKYLKLWQKRGARAWEDEWWLLGQRVGNKIGRLINAPDDTISMHPNVTSAQAVILSCFDFSGKRNKAIMVEQEFPSLLYLYQSWLSKTGHLEIIECPDGISVPTDKLIEAIDETTLLVSISNVLFRSAYILDVKAVVDKAHRVGAMVVLDIFQSIGVLPVDLRELNADFAVGGCLKWLCGGPGACFLYVRQDLIPKMEPRYTGWLAHENPFAFDKTGMKYTTGSYRFLSGTPVVSALYICQAGLDIISNIGIDRIRQRSIEMTDRLIEQAQIHNWPVYTPKESDRRGGTVSINIAEAKQIADELLKRDFLIDYRPEAGIRVSPHFYNTDREIDDLVNEIVEISSQDSYQAAKM